MNGTDVKSVWCLVALVVVMLTSMPAPAAPGVHLVLSDYTRQYQQVAAAIATHLDSHHPDVEVVTRLADGSAGVDSDDLVVSIGTRASELSYRRPVGAGQLAIFVTETGWLDIVDRHPGRTPKAVIFMDQPVDNYVALAKVLAPEARRYGALLGPVSARHRQRLQAQVAAAGGQLVYDFIDTHSNPLQVLGPLMDNADLFLALPDQEVINRNIAQWVLHLGFKMKIPVFGFSQAYTQAGAAASLFTSPADISRQAIRWLEAYLAGADENLWRSHPPDSFTIAINPSVSRTLGLPAMDDDSLRRAVEQRLGARPLP